MNDKRETWSVAGCDGSADWCDTRHIYSSADRDAGGTGCIAVVRGSRRNAVRIAAAPEVLRALELLLSRCSGLDQSATHDGLQNCDALRVARMAIEKANSL